MWNIHGASDPVLGICWVQAASPGGGQRESPYLLRLGDVAMRITSGPGQAGSSLPSTALLEKLLCSACVFYLQMASSL